MSGEGFTSHDVNTIKKARSQLAKVLELLKAKNKRIRAATYKPSEYQEKREQVANRNSMAIKGLTRAQRSLDGLLGRGEEAPPTRLSMTINLREGGKVSLVANED